MITIEEVERAQAGEKVIITLEGGLKALLWLDRGALSLTILQ